MPELRRGDDSRAIGRMESRDAVVPDELVLRVWVGWASPGIARGLSSSAGSNPSTASPIAHDADEATTPLIDRESTPGLSCPQRGTSPSSLRTGGATPASSRLARRSHRSR
jgi:hypothetical protein